MNKVYCIITKGCYSCNIMKKILKSVCNHYNITFDVHDCKDIPDSLKSITFDDFPTTVIIKDDKIVSYFSGTVNVNRMKKILEELNL